MEEWDKMVKIEKKTELVWIINFPYSIDAAFDLSDRPRGYFTNGHVQVDAMKMSKSKGNFLMMDDCVKRFSADATRSVIHP